MRNAPLPASLASHLAGDGTVSSLVAKAERLRLLQEALLERVPPEMARYCHVANVRGDQAVVLVANNAIAAKLKMLAPRLLDGFVKVFPDVKAVKLEVQFHAAATIGAGRSRDPVVPPPAAPLESLADTLPASALRDAIRSLARKGRAADD